MQYLTLWDLILTPFYLLILIFIAKKQRDKRYPRGHALRKYYLPGLYAKFGGAIFIGLVYAFYYKGGDTFNYFSHAQIINSSLEDSFDKWVKLILHNSIYESPDIYSYASQLYWYDSPAEYTVGVITAILGLFTFTTYLPTAILFAYLAYTGIWAMYKTFVQLYPKLIKPLAIVFLFIPSTVVWGSGIFKDTICMFGLGWLTYATFRCFVNKDFSFKNILLILLSFYLIAQVKMYILLGFMPALAMWLLLTYSNQIKSAATRWAVNILFIAFTIAGALFFMQRFAEELNKYSLENIAQTAKVTQNWTNFASGDEGASYSIGEIDGSIGGLLRLFPQAVVVTFFRPFPWEARKVMVLFSALESLVFLYFTLQMFFKPRRKPLSHLVKDPTIFFCLVFALIFGFAVGVSSGNFGALSRYKIPALPFYGAVLAIMIGEAKAPVVSKKGKLSRRIQPAM